MKSHFLDNRRRTFSVHCAGSSCFGAKSESARCNYRSRIVRPWDNIHFIRHYSKRFSAGESIFFRRNSCLMNGHYVDVIGVKNWRFRTILFVSVTHLTFCWVTRSDFIKSFSFFVFLVGFIGSLKSKAFQTGLHKDDHSEIDP